MCIVELNSAVVAVNKEMVMVTVMVMVMVMVMVLVLWMVIMPCLTATESRV